MDWGTFSWPDFVNSVFPVYAGLGFSAWTLFMGRIELRKRGTMAYLQNEVTDPNIIKTSDEFTFVRDKTKLLTAKLNQTSMNNDGSTKVRRYLNRMEILSASVLSKTLDEKLVKEAFGLEMQLNYEITKHYINEIRRLSQSSYYCQDLEKLMVRWSKEK